MTWTDGRVGRARGVADVEVDGADTDAVLAAVVAAARRHLGSRLVDADYYPAAECGNVYAGTRPVAEFSLTPLDDAARDAMVPGTDIVET